MNDTEKYLFDLNGYLVLEDVLSSADVAELNRLIDEQNLPEPGLGTRDARFGGSGGAFEVHGAGDSPFLEWGKPFCDLLDHPGVLPYLREIIGDGFRLDHYYGIYMRDGTAGLRLHGGLTPFDPTQQYAFKDGRMYNGLIVVGWNLTDTGPGRGGFLCVPGSHKANLPVPEEYVHEPELAKPVVVPETRAGSAVIFTEALTHGTAPWSGPVQRRSLLFKYSPAQQSWGPEYGQPPARVRLTARQRLLFEPPYHANRKSLFDDV